MYKMFIYLWAIFGAVTLVAVSHDESPRETTTLPPIIDTVKILLEKTRINDMSILFIADTAKTTTDISAVLAKDYAELTNYVIEQKLEARRYIAWYYSYQQPWPMDVAVEINKIPLQTKGRIRARKLQGGEAVVAHMWGPYDQVSQAYMRIMDWLKQNNRKGRGSPFEVYINDPASVKSPYEIQTDIYQPLE
jgi:effector-binding domain-containing protein